MCRILAGLMFLTVLSCKSDPGTGNRLPSDFVDFYEQFHTDSLFQMAHIQFPLEGLPSHVLQIEVSDTTFAWNPANWVMHRKFDDKNKEFVREIFALDTNIVVETIRTRSMEVGMERRFVKTNGNWKLIYYVGMNRLVENPSLKDSSADIKKL